MLPKVQCMSSLHIWNTIGAVLWIFWSAAVVCRQRIPTLLSERNEIASFCREQLADAAH
jgi:hypothetical protein